LIFVDTSFWVALRNRRDAHHPFAVNLFQTYADRGWVTSNQVVGETWTYLRKKAGHAAAVTFLDAMERSPRVGLLLVERPLEEEALKWLRRHDERVYSFVDATSFALMRSHRMLEALAFDGDFDAAGFVELRS